MDTPDPVIITATTFDEMAKAICDLGFHRGIGDLTWPHLEPEQKRLRDMFVWRAGLISSRTSTDLADLAALLILEAMVSQHLYDLRLAAQSLPPFGNGPWR